MQNLARFKKYFVHAAIFTISLVFVALNTASTSAQSPTCSAVWYDFHSGNQLASVSSIISDHQSIATVADLDAAGYDTRTGQIYGLNSSEELVRTDPTNGAQTNLGQVTSSDGLRTLSDEFVNDGVYDRFRVGDMSGGKLFVIPGGDTAGQNTGGTDLLFADRDDLKNVFEIDVDTLVYTRHDIDYPGVDASPDVYESFFAGDAVYVDGVLYSLNGNRGYGNGQLAVANVSTGEGYSVTAHGLPRNKTYGAQWLARSQDGNSYEMYAVINNDGAIYRINGYDTNYPVAQLVGYTSAHDIADSAGCPDISAPALNVVASDDFSDGVAGTQLSIDWSDNDYAASDLVVGEVDKTSAAGAAVIVGPNGALEYQAIKDFAGTDSFAYEACTTVVGRTYCDQATVHIDVQTSTLSVATSLTDLGTDPQTLRLDIDTSNTGTVSATSVVTMVELPDGVTIQGDGWQCDNGLCTSASATIDVDAAHSVSVTLAVDDSATGQKIVNVAVESDQNSAVQSSNSFTVDSDSGSITVVQGASTSGSQSSDNQSASTDSDDVAASSSNSSSSAASTTDSSAVTDDAAVTAVLAETGQNNRLLIASAVVTILGVGVLAYATKKSIGYSLR
ncbi:MAG: hypothetical protein AAF413_04805 [Patescibacteria group bacterium]